MSDSLKELYQEIILKHNKHPVGKETFPSECDHADGRNPICGDEVRLGLRIDEETERVTEARFQGASCAICTASASMLAESVTGKSKVEVEALHQEVCEALSGGELLDSEKHGDLHALNGVHSFPARLKCAQLAWDVLKDVLSKKGPEE